MANSQKEIVPPGEVTYVSVPEPATRHRRVYEKHVEQALCDAVKSIVGIPYKFTSPARRSVPDRMCVFPDGMIIFVELKAPGERPTKLQQMEMERIASLNQRVCWLDGLQAARSLVEWWKQQAGISRETQELNFL